ncbi:MAG: TolC family protein [Cytophagaceae bacterium]|jgi:outer membrane protein TolC|nr:TolC family protein [Cytophagaceae bacterium]
MIRIVACLLFLQGWCQNLHLSYTDAVARALQQNLEVTLIQNEARQAAIQNTPGNAGMLPSIDLQANMGAANNNTRQEFSNGLQVNKNGVQSSSNTAGVYLQWTLFDGFKMFAAKQRLNLQEQQGELALKMAIEKTVLTTSAAYFQVVKQQQYLRSLETSMQLTEDRVSLARHKQRIGTGSSLELLQARMDFNAQQSAYLIQQQQLLEVKNNLKLLLQLEESGVITVDSIIPFDSLETEASILQSLDQQNASIGFAKNQLAVQEKMVLEKKSWLAPRIGFTTQYQFVRNQNAAGFALLNQNLGLSGGLQFSWNIFNGGTLRNALQIAQLDAENSLQQWQYTRYKVALDTRNAYSAWKMQQSIMQLEKENVSLAEESLKIIEEKVKNGLGNYLEIRVLQQSYEMAQYRAFQSLYDLKMAELEVKKQAGLLVK